MSEHDFEIRARRKVEVDIKLFKKLKSDQKVSGLMEPADCKCVECRAQLDIRQKLTELELSYA